MFTVKDIGAFSGAIFATIGVEAKSTPNISLGSDDNEPRLQQPMKKGNE
jgi:hypothetical protein